jgi:broad specificity phosphatase PhoE
MKVYLIRHGQSEGNLKNFHVGWGQVKLTEKGIEDAKRTGNLISNLKFDRIYSSDLIRAIDTARIAVAGCEPLQTDLMREMSVGSLEWRPVEECYATLGEQYVRARQERDFRCYGGENIAMIQERVATFTKLLEADANTLEHVAVFCHEGTIQAVFSNLMGCAYNIWKTVCNNGSVTCFEYIGGAWRLVFWNYNGPLAD